MHGFKTVIDDLENNKFSRKTVKSGINLNNRGSREKSDIIEFKDVLLATPNGDMLIEKLNMKIPLGYNTFIKGPNGSGKSSIFRVLGKLWPLFEGTISKPDKESIFYIPQRPYLPFGTLRDQII